MYVHMLMYSYINQGKERHLALFFVLRFVELGGEMWVRGAGCGAGVWEFFLGLFKSGKG